jgi:hypothetical protein
MIRPAPDTDVLLHSAARWRSISLLDMEVFPVHSSSEEHGHLLVFVVSQVKKRAILFQNKRFQRRIVFGAR